jgi:hypothetical protein
VTSSLSGAIETLDEDTPAIRAVLNRFMSAMAEQEFGAAFALFAPDVRAELSTADLANLYDLFEGGLFEGYESLAITETTIRRDLLQGQSLELLATINYDGPLGPFGNQGQLEATLVPEDGEWVLWYVDVSRDLR